MRQIVYGLIILLWSQVATSCEEFFTIGDSQVKETQEQVANSDKLDFDAILAFERLMCADRSFVRSFASEIGLSSKNTTIRSRALLSALMEKETITLEPYFNEGITNAEKEFVKKNSALPYGVVFRSKDQSCISLFEQNKCNPDYVVSVEGEEVTLRYQKETARLTLNSEGKLEGTYAQEDSEIIRVPVRISLR